MQATVTHSVHFALHTLTKQLLINISKCHLSGLHLEIDPRRAKRVYEEEEGRSPVYMCITLGGSGGMLPQKILDFRLSESASGAFSGTL